MAIKFLPSGTAAVSLMALANAQAAGRGKCIAAEGDFPRDWRKYLGEGRDIALGYDIATTTGQKSNPSSITILQKEGPLYCARLILRFKTEHHDKALAFLDEAVDLGPDLRARRLVIDGSNERYYADMTKKHFLGKVPVDIVVSGESYPYEEMNYKNFLGNYLVNHLEENRIALPDERWIKDDFRLVVKDRGSFNNQLDPAGNHADTFDSTKLALHGFKSGGPVEAEGAATSNLSTHFSPSMANNNGVNRAFV